MAEEKKTVELKDEELEKVSGGDVEGQIDGNCGITTTYQECTRYNSSNALCSTCQGKPRRVANIPSIPGGGSYNLETGSRRGGGQK